MKFCIKTTRAWRYRDHRRGMRELPAGLHRVPEDISEQGAERAISEGMAQRISQPTIMQPEAPMPKRRGRPPGRKALGPAPENKSALG